MFSMALIQASNRSPILIPRKQIWEKVFHLISCYAYDTYMHDMKSMKWRVVHKKTWLIMVYYRSMHKQKSWERKKGMKEKHFKSFFHFFTFFYNLDHLLFKQILFVKRKHLLFDHFQHDIFSTKPLYSIHVIFCHFSFNTKKCFFFLRKTNTTLIFRFFVFYSK